MAARGRGDTATPEATHATRETSANASDPLVLLVIGDDVHTTEVLPGVGEAIIGRASDCDVRIDDASISRTHAKIVLDPLSIVDLGSANGTVVREQRLAPNTPAALQLNEAVRVGAVTIVVQRRHHRSRTRRVRSHDYFESRIEDECARGARHAMSFGIVHIVLRSGGSDSEGCDAAAACLREGDVVAPYGRGELELMLLDTTAEHGLPVVRRVEQQLRMLGFDLETGSAWYPRDSREAATLAARARARAHGQPVSVSSEIVVADEKMSALHQLVARVAAADISVLLLGETGVGKEVVAEQIHRLSARADRPFLRLNCAALTETLLESELFGHERGAFTGALQSKPGLFEVAEGGVVFLDEVGELSLATQAKLLRVLDERKVLRVGSVVPRSIDVRVVSATNRDLDSEVERGTYRLDLLYRLNAMSILIPPLRERIAEIEPLAIQFLSAAGLKLERPSLRLAPTALAAMQAYPWPGNIRELRNVMERAAILANSDEIEATDLPLGRMQSTRSSTTPPRVTAQMPSVIVSDEPPDPELQKVLDALDQCHGNQTHAAKLLGVSRRTLVNKLEKYAVPRPRKR